MEKPKFKENLVGLDFINSRPKTERPKLIAEMRLMAIAMTDPKLEYEEIIALPLNTFLEYLLSYREKYKKMYEKIAVNKGEKPGLQFAKEEDYTEVAKGEGKGGIHFSTVK